jgi:hypothetical protein
MFCLPVAHKCVCFASLLHINVYVLPPCSTSAYMVHVLVWYMCAYMLYVLIWHMCLYGICAYMVYMLIWYMCLYGICDYMVHVLVWYICAYMAYVLVFMCQPYAEVLIDTR